MRGNQHAYGDHSTTPPVTVLSSFHTVVTRERRLLRYGGAGQHIAAPSSAVTAARDASSRCASCGVFLHSDAAVTKLST